MDTIGSARLREIDPANPPRRFIGLALGPRDIPQHGMSIVANGEVVGGVTSGTFSWTLGHGIATGYVAGDLAEAAPVEIDMRGRPVPAERVRHPFVKRPAPPR